MCQHPDNSFNEELLHQHRGVNGSLFQCAETCPGCWRTQAFLAQLPAELVCGINYSVLQAIVVIIRSFVIPSFFKQLQNLYGDFFIRSTFIWVKIYTGQNLYRSKFNRSKFILVILEAFSNCVFIVRWCCGGAMSNLSSSYSVSKLESSEPVPLRLWPVLTSLEFLALTAQQYLWTLLCGSLIISRKVIFVFAKICKDKKTYFFLFLYRMTTAYSLMFAVFQTILSALRMAHSY
jgi:hypothetical protein